jgi:hypothetical protein
MLIETKPSNEHLSEQYLAAWPVHKQLEAHADAAGGDRTKLDAMLRDLASIKENSTSIT